VDDVDVLACPQRLSNSVAARRVVPACEVNERASVRHAVIGFGDKIYALYGAEAAALEDTAYVLFTSI